MDEAKRESDVFMTIEKINKKLSSLRNVLSPIIYSVPKPESVDRAESGTTKLSKVLHDIDENIADILDTIHL